MLNEEQIIQNIQSNIDVDAGFRQLVNAYKERIYWHIRGVVSTHEDAVDVMQNTFLKAYRNIKKFNADAKFYTWLYRIATNESINLLKKSNRYRNDDSENMLNHKEADVYLDGDEAVLILQRAIEQLPHKQRLVFNMKYFDEMTYDEISEILETSVGALKASFHHAKNKIEAFVKQQSL
ncbi:RNA polymerase sigma factor [Portibacter marinus]|uniref:RNA polymerase sigma factor n=1 Tax=Portibacter marinus TaxID=2898660 RepID=UPI001F346F89|nr:RNA polymerase sigma factor [Portibacter marinus]